MHGTFHQCPFGRAKHAQPRLDVRSWSMCLQRTTDPGFGRRSLLPGRARVERNAIGCVKVTEL